MILRCSWVRQQMQLFALAKVMIILVVMLVLEGCASNPVIGEAYFVLMSEQSEMHLGKQSHQYILEQDKVYKALGYRN